MRKWVLALALMALVPCTAHAQEDRNWSPRLRVTPWLGWSLDFRQQGDAEIVTPSNFFVHAYEVEFGGSVPLGLTLDLSVWDRVGIVAGGAFSPRGRGHVTDLDDELTFATPKSDLLLGKVGLALRLREENPEIQLRQLNGLVYAGPAIIRISDDDAGHVPGGTNLSTQHIGLNIGTEGELPLSDRHIALTIGVEDWMIFWNNDKYRERVAHYLEQRPAGGSVITIDAGTSHLLILRAGFTFRF